MKLKSYQKQWKLMGIIHDVYCRNSDEPKTCYYSVMWCKLSKKKVASRQSICDTCPDSRFHKVDKVANCTIMVISYFVFQHKKWEGDAILITKGRTVSPWSTWKGRSEYETLPLDPPAARSTWSHWTVMYFVIHLLPNHWHKCFLYYN